MCAIAEIPCTLASPGFTEAGLLSYLHCHARSEPSRPSQLSPTQFPKLNDESSHYACAWVSGLSLQGSSMAGIGGIPLPQGNSDVEGYVHQLINPATRENALLELSKKRENFPELAPYLWYSFGAIAALLQEIVSIYPLLSPPALTAHASNRVCNALALLQCVASHNETRSLFLQGGRAKFAAYWCAVAALCHGLRCVYFCGRNRSTFLRFCAMSGCLQRTSRCSCTPSSTP